MAVRSSFAFSARMADLRDCGPSVMESRELPIAGVIQKILLLFGFRTRHKIEGNSMSPVLEDGEEVIVKKTARVRIGDIVMARHPFKSSVKMAKRITGVDANGKFFLVGDNAEESTDSRGFGPVPVKDILGKVVCRLRLRV